MLLENLLRLKNEILWEYFRELDMKGDTPAATAPISKEDKENAEEL